MNLDPVLRKDKFEIWRQKTNDIISLVNSISAGTGTQTTISETPPPTPSNGDLWWDSTSGKLKIYYDDGDSLQWLDAFLSSSNPPMTTISDSAPLNPNIGDLWWDSSTGKLKIYYFDGNSCQWIDAFTPSGVDVPEVTISQNPPTSPQIGELWWDDLNSKLKIYHSDGTTDQWIDSYIYDNATVSDGVIQGYSNIDDSSRNALDVVEYDTNSGYSFKHSSPSDDWEINLTNLSMTANQKTQIEVIVEQGTTGYFPKKLQINGNFIQVKWESLISVDGNGDPIPNTDSIDKISYEIYCNDPAINDYLILGQLKNF